MHDFIITYKDAISETRKIVIRASDGVRAREIFQAGHPGFPWVSTQVKI